MRSVQLVILISPILLTIKCDVEIPRITLPKPVNHTAFGEQWAFQQCIKATSPIEINEQLEDPFCVQLEANETMPIILSNYRILIMVVNEQNAIVNGHNCIDSEWINPIAKEYSRKTLEKREKKALEDQRLCTAIYEGNDVNIATLGPNITYFYIDPSIRSGVARSYYRTDDKGKRLTDMFFSFYAGDHYTQYASLFQKMGGKDWPIVWIRNSIINSNLFDDDGTKWSDMRSMTFQKGIERRMKDPSILTTPILIVGKTRLADPVAAKKRKTIYTISKMSEIRSTPDHFSIYNINIKGDDNVIVITQQNGTDPDYCALAYMTFDNEVIYWNGMENEQIYMQIFKDTVYRVMIELHSCFDFESIKIEYTTDGDPEDPKQPNKIIRNPKIDYTLPIDNGNHEVQLIKVESSDLRTWEWISVKYRGEKTFHYDYVSISRMDLRTDEIVFTRDLFAKYVKVHSEAIIRLEPNTFSLEFFICNPNFEITLKAFHHYYPEYLPYWVDRSMKYRSQVSIMNHFEMSTYGGAPWKELTVSRREDFFGDPVYQRRRNETKSLCEKKKVRDIIKAKADDEPICTKEYKDSDPPHTHEMPNHGYKAFFDMTTACHTIKLQLHEGLAAEEIEMTKDMDSKKFDASRDSPKKFRVQLDKSLHYKVVVSRSEQTEKCVNSDRVDIFVFDGQQLISGQGLMSFYFLELTSVFELVAYNIVHFVIPNECFVVTISPQKGVNTMPFLVTRILLILFITTVISLVFYVKLRQYLKIRKSMKEKLSDSSMLIVTKYGSYEGSIPPLKSRSRSRETMLRTRESV